MNVLRLYKIKFDLIISCIIEILLLLVTGALKKTKSFSNYPSFVINASLYQHTGMLFDIILMLIQFLKKNERAFTYVIYTCFLHTTDLFS